MCRAEPHPPGGAVMLLIVGLVCAVGALGVVIGTGYNPWGDSDCSRRHKEPTATTRDPELPFFTMGVCPRCGAVVGSSLLGLEAEDFEWRAVRDQDSPIATRVRVQLSAPMPGLVKTSRREDA